MPDKLSDLIDDVVAPIARKRGVVEAQLLESWESIIGAEWKNCSLYLHRVTFPRGKNNHGTLHIQTDNVTANLVQHESARFIERVNQSLGFSAIAQLRFEPYAQEYTIKAGEEKNMTKDVKKDFAHSIDPTIIQKDREMIEHIDDDELRGILEGMLTQLSK